jgi:hypothetical protein
MVAANEKQVYLFQLRSLARIKVRGRINMHVGSSAPHRVAIFREKILFRPFRGNGKCSEFCSVPFVKIKTRNSVPNHFAEDKKRSEIRSKPFCRREKHSKLHNFVPNLSPEDKNARTSLLNHFAEEKNT